MSRRQTNRDHAKKQHQPAVEDEIVATQLEQLLTPAIFAQSNYDRQLGLRNRILNLPLMLASGGADITMAKRTRSESTQQNTLSTRILVE